MLRPCSSGHTRVRATIHWKPGQWHHRFASTPPVTPIFAVPPFLVDVVSLLMANLYLICQRAHLSLRRHSCPFGEVDIFRRDLAPRRSATQR